MQFGFVTTHSSDKHLFSFRPVGKNQINLPTDPYGNKNANKTLVSKQ